MNYKVLLGGLKSDFCFKDIAAIEHLTNAERFPCLCCSSIKYLEPITRVIVENTLWERRRLNLLLTTGMAERLRDSVRFLLVERDEVDEVNFSRRFHFSFKLRRHETYVCEYVESEIEDGDAHFPTFDFKCPLDGFIGTFAFFPADVWVDENDVHPLRLFEELRVRFGLSHPQALEFIRTLTFIVKNENLWNASPISYSDVLCADCGRIHNH
jgi:hypothetical protein